jgi:hypothetical protein
MAGLDDAAVLAAAERVADGAADPSELPTIGGGARHPAAVPQAHAAAALAGSTAAAERMTAAGDASHPLGAGDVYAAELGERRAQARLLRDIFGNPFRPVVFDPRWRTADTVALATGIYEDRAFDRLPLLADALMDAGCADEQVLGHCRSEGHTRGCFVVDLVLGKE